MSTTATPIRFSGNTRMRDAFATYIRYPSPRLLLGLLAATLIARVVVGQWSWWDLVVVAVLVAAQPFRRMAHPHLHPALSPQGGCRAPGGPPPRKEAPRSPP